MNALFSNRIFQHTAFWIGQLVFYAVIYGSYTDNYGQTFYEEAIYLPVKIIFTYFVMYYLLPILLAGKYTQFFGLFFVGSLASGVAQRYIAFNFDYPIYYPEALKDSFFWFPKVSKMIASIYPYTFFAVAIKLLKYWYANKQAQQVLLQERLQAELKFLKTQIHPHFLFNTLNNLYALTLKKSDLAPAMVLKLSELINYMLYECREDEVLLEKEIKFIYNYVDIERLRYGDKLDVDIRVRGNVNGRKITPLLLLPFVENCFKHGASLELDQSWVKIEIELLPDRTLFKVENNKVATADEPRMQGIGINNAKRRLDLLYPGNHELRIINGEETFLVILSLNTKTVKEEKELKVSKPLRAAI
ncbi:MAG TPA: histidine kinase [Cyclobacteriaceae bacterium]|nr:histidine kinase [Cyclobacteriaceae bacterium]